MNNTIVKALLFHGLLGFTASVLAIPTLQIGAPGGAGQGVYAPYTASLSNPTEDQTARTSGNTLLVGGVYKPGTVLLGGNTYGGDDWSSYGFDTSFNSHGAILMASVSNTLNTLTINGNSAFYTTTSNLFPNNHAPLGSANHFMFFDIGDFTNNTQVVDNFVTELAGGCPATSCADGQVKSLTIGGVSGYSWIHFDSLALVTTIETTGNKKTGLITSDETSVANNPGSHDVTWINPHPGTGGGGTDVPEPATTLLLGLGLIGLWFARRARKSNDFL